MKFAVFTDPHLNAYDTKKEEFRSFVKKLNTEVDGFICSGDLCSTDVNELDDIFAFMRQETDKPVLVVFGNHDYWNQSNQYSLDEIIAYQANICKKHNIIYLENESFETPDSFICGYDGWYGQDTGTNVTKDYDYIPKTNSYGSSTFHYLKRKEMNGMYKVIDYVIPNKKKVCVTHFGFGSLDSIQKELNELNSTMIVSRVSSENDAAEKAYDVYNAHKRHAVILAEKFDLVIFGHSHRINEYTIGNCKFMNVGADYTKSPENFYKIIEL